MNDRPLRILGINVYDRRGGASYIAYQIHGGCRSRGHASYLYVGWKRTKDPGVTALPNLAFRGAWARFWGRASGLLKPLAGAIPGAGFLSELTEACGRPLAAFRSKLGICDFDFPSTSRILESFPHPPDIIHCHNLNGRFFDLRALASLSASIPTVLTLHDAWALSGLCGHSLDCERWVSGCGECPHMKTLYSEVRADMSAVNWRLKRDIFARCRLSVAAPSRWLMEKVDRSILEQAIVRKKVIPHGVDLEVFSPGDISAARAIWDIPRDALVVLAVGTMITKNRWKDYPTAAAAFVRASERLVPRRSVLVCLGESRPAERRGGAEIRFIAPQTDRARIAELYRACDVYLHAALADNFPTAILEAFACGKPVVATAVGGIPEEVDDGKTGFLCPLRDEAAMGEALVRLLTDNRLREAFGRNAREEAQRRFDQERLVDDYLRWYREIIEEEAAR